MPVATNPPFRTLQPSQPNIPRPKAPKSVSFVKGLKDSPSLSGGTEPTRTQVKLRERKARARPVEVGSHRIASISSAGVTPPQFPEMLSPSTGSSTPAAHQPAQALPDVHRHPAQNKPHFSPQHNYISPQPALSKSGYPSGSTGLTPPPQYSGGSYISPAAATIPRYHLSGTSVTPPPPYAYAGPLYPLSNAKSSKFGGPFASLSTSVMPFDQTPFPWNSVPPNPPPVAVYQYIYPSPMPHVPTSQTQKDRETYVMEHDAGYNLGVPPAALSDDTSEVASENTGDDIPSSEERPEPAEEPRNPASQVPQPQAPRQPSVASTHLGSPLLPATIHPGLYSVPQRSRLNDVLDSAPTPPLGPPRERYQGAPPRRPLVPLAPTWNIAQPSHSAPASARNVTQPQNPQNVAEPSHSALSPARTHVTEPQNPQNVAQPPQPPNINVTLTLPPEVIDPNAQGEKIDSEIYGLDLVADDPICTNCGNRISIVSSIDLLRSLFAQKFPQPYQTGGRAFGLSLHIQCSRCHTIQCRGCNYGVECRNRERCFAKDGCGVKRCCPHVRALAIYYYLSDFDTHYLRLICNDRDAEHAPGFNERREGFNATIKATTEELQLGREFVEKLKSTLKAVDFWLAPITEDNTIHSSIATLISHSFLFEAVTFLFEAFNHNDIWSDLGVQLVAKVFYRALSLTVTLAKRHIHRELVRTPKFFNTSPGLLRLVWGYAADGHVVTGPLQEGSSIVMLLRLVWMTEVDPRSNCRLQPWVDPEASDLFDYLDRVFTGLEEEAMSWPRILDYIDTPSIGLQTLSLFTPTPSSSEANK
ncbi:hypothetical protein DXG03_007329 [Asterophora parasitica]|uniref:Uncharacterized protein n=1 Tax=Asterophora parasitica TaxID=117018 RepID=A0A9P7G8Q0_9AGAR|nr:hypothetical protein DXG03_007329 [Asterophora parasitica]